MAGSSPSRSSRSTTSTRLGIQTRRPLPTLRRVLRRARLALARRPPVAHQPGGGPVVAGHPHQLAVDRGALLDEARGRVDVGAREQVEQPLADHHVLVERDRPALLDDGRGLAAHRGQPVAELLGVAHRRAEAHHRHRLREVDDHLLPHRPAAAVGEVVHLVHDHEPEAEEGPAPGVQHVAEHLGGHHHDRRLAVDDVVAGQQADLVGAVAVDEVVVLLVAQRLDRRRVEALAARAQREVDGELADHGLAGAGRGGHQHPVPVLDLPAGAQLEVVEREVVEGAEVTDDRVVLVLHVCGVPLRRGQLVGAHRSSLRTTTYGVDPSTRPARTPRSAGAGRSARRRRTS